MNYEKAKAELQRCLTENKTITINKLNNLLHAVEINTKSFRTKRETLFYNRVRQRNKKIRRRQNRIYKMDARIKELEKMLRECGCGENLPGNE